MIASGLLLVGRYRASRVSHELAVLLSMSAGFFDFPKSPNKTRPRQTETMTNKNA
jgi:hypothetical protein